MTEPFRIGLIGCGTVGSGVLDLLERRAAELTRATGRSFRVVRVAVRDASRPRNVAALDRGVELTEDAMAVARAPDLDVVAEVAGGVDSPRDWMVAALTSGKDVVTANKAALAGHGPEIFAAAVENGRRVYYEASVAAAIPIIEVLQNGLVANRVTRLDGILNGTCNFILSRMERDGISYEAALTEAQQRGFAEADPTLDVSGEDAAHKLALLGGIITHAPIDARSIPTEGLTEITAQDIVFARELGYAVRMLAIARCTEESTWDFRVHPTLVPSRGLLAQVEDEFNAVQLRSTAAGPMVLYGKGAGSLPTASSVVADLARAARREPTAYGPAAGEPPPRVDLGDVALRNYIRMEVIDAPGVLGRITSFLGMRSISIASLRQPEAHVGREVPVVLVTHRTVDRVVSSALRELAEAKLLTKPATRIRIED